MNCRLKWARRQMAEPVADSLTESDVEPAYAFSAAELSRLMVYRAAVMAGYYTDHPTPERDLFGAR